MITPGPLGGVIAEGLAVGIFCISIFGIINFIIFFIIFFFFISKLITQKFVLRFIFSLFLSILITWGTLILIIKIYPQKELFKICFDLFKLFKK